jgi:hypothetical protein
MIDIIGLMMLAEGEPNLLVARLLRTSVFGLVYFDLYGVYCSH